MKLVIFILTIAGSFLSGESSAQYKILTQSEKNQADHEVVIKSGIIISEIDKLDSLRINFRDYSLKVNFSKLTSNEKKILAEKVKGLLRQIVKIENAIANLKLYANQNMIENDKKTQSLFDMIKKGEDWFDSVRKPLETSLEGIRKKYNLIY